MTNDIETSNINERFYIFDNFLTSNEHILNRGDDEWDSSKIFFQLAIEHANKSPLSIDAEKFEEDGKVDFNYVRDVNRNNDIYLSPLIAILDVFESYVSNVIVLDNGDILSYANGRWGIRVWDKLNYKLVKSLDKDGDKHGSGIDGVIILKNGDILSYGEDKEIIIWNQNDYEVIEELKFDKENDYSIDKVLILSNQNIIAFMDNGKAEIWENKTYKHIATLDGHNKIIENMKILENESIMTISRDNAIIWDNKTYIKIKELNISGFVDYTMMIPNNKFITYYTNIFIWNQNTYEHIEILKGHKSEILGIKVLKNKNIVSFSSDSIKIWDMDNYKCICVINKGHDKQIKGIEVLENQNIVSYSSDCIRVWSCNTYKCIKVFKGHKNNIKSIKVLKNQDILTYSDVDITPKIWSKDTYELLIILRHEMPITSVELLPNQDILTYSDDNIIRIWDYKTYQCKSILKGHLDKVIGIEVLKNDRLISYSQDNTLRVWNLNTKYSNTRLSNLAKYTHQEKNDTTLNEIAYLDSDFVEGHLYQFRVVKVSNTQIASYSYDCVKIWDIQSRKCLMTLATEPAEILKVLDANTIMVYSDQHISIWNLKTAKEKKLDSRKMRLIDSVETLSNGNFVSCEYNNPKEGFNGELVIWDKDSYKYIVTIDKNNIDKYYNDLITLDNIVDSENFIYANYFKEYHLNIIDKKTDKKLQWHSNYKPEVNALLGENITINDGDNGRILKVIKQKNK